jgi:hypothetical protein
LLIAKLGNFDDVEVEINISNIKSFNDLNDTNILKRPIQMEVVAAVAVSEDAMPDLVYEPDAKSEPYNQNNNNNVDVMDHSIELSDQPQQQLLTIELLNSDLSKIKNAVKPQQVNDSRLPKPFNAWTQQPFGFGYPVGGSIKRKQTKKRKHLNKNAKQTKRRNPKNANKKHKKTKKRNHLKTFKQTKSNKKTKKT